MAKTRQLVIIDDDHDFRNLIVEFFKPQGYRMICFADAEAALKESAISGSEWDAVLCDLKLPGISGVEFLRRGKEASPAFACDPHHHAEEFGDRDRCHQERRLRFYR